MKKGYSISLFIIAILLAFSMTIGTSYAFWNANLTVINTNEVTSGCLQIEVNDLDVNGLSTSINLSNAYPISDVRGLNTQPYTLTIKNICSINAKYTVLLNRVSNNSLTDDKLKYHFVQTSPIETTMTPALVSSMLQTTLETDFVNNYSSYELATGILNAQTNNVTDSVTFDLRLWIDEAAGIEVMGSTYEASVSVYAEASN